MTPPAPAAPPALTVVIAVDGLSSTLFDRYRSGFSGGFARLGGGARFSLEGGGELVGGLSHENEVSMELHRRFGFAEVGRLPQVGAKFGRWLDLVLVELLLDRDAAPRD